MAAVLDWHKEKPQFIIKSAFLSFIVNFTHEEMVVDADYSLPAKIFVTKENRAKAIRFIDSIADDLGF